jgi:hypothetical protein
MSDMSTSNPQRIGKVGMVDSVLEQRGPWLLQHYVMGEMSFVS